MTEQPFETLIKGKAEKKKDSKWYPTRIEDIRKALLLPEETEADIVLRKNISYSLQYLQYLQKQLDELEVTPALHAMLVKTYIITGMSVLEGIFAYIVKEHGWWKTTDLEEIKEFTSNPVKMDDSYYVTKTILCKKIPKRELENHEVSLDSLIKILDNHHKGLKIEHTIYPALQRARELRNRIHLNSSVEDITDNDYNAFTDKEKTEMQWILYKILTSESISNSPEPFAFLKTPDTN